MGQDWVLRPFSSVGILVQLCFLAPKVAEGVLKALGPADPLLLLSGEVNLKACWAINALMPLVGQVE